MSWRAHLWNKLQSLGFVVCAGVFALGVALMFLPLLRERHSLQQEAMRLDREIARQEALERKQKAENEGLRSDPEFVERVARDKLNLARSDEMIFRFEPRSSAAPRTR